ncbi:MAG: VWA domain-containing protein [Bacteroidales bacterium]|nr:VWA domain-containing protein [Bacteroidales bacterium]
MEIKKQKNLKRAGRSFGKIGMRLLKFFTLFLLIFMTINVSAQIISTAQEDYDINTSCNANVFVQSGDISGAVIELPPAVIGTDYCFQIPLASLTWGSGDIIEAEFIVTNPCSGGPSFDDTNGNISWSGGDICIPPGTGSHLEFELTIIDSNNNSEDRTFWLPVLRSIPVKIVYILDRSGSMGWTVQGGGTDTRWEILTQSVETFSTTMETFLQYNDAVGLTYFATDVIQPGDPINSGFITTSSGTSISTTLTNLMEQQTPQGATAMGSGLKDGRNKLDGNNPINATKIVLLFTDGEQNRTPLVNDDGESLDDGSVLNVSDCLTQDSIRYYTIAMGTGGLNIERLEKIATESNADYHAENTFDENLLNTFFNDNLKSILKGGSPQIISQQTRKLINGEYSTKFKINSNCTKILFQLSYNKGDSMYMTIKKGEDVLTEEFYKKESDFYQILSLDLPHKANNYIYSQGEWTVTVKGNSEENFNLTCITDDHYLKYKCGTDKGMYTNGDTIKFSVDLSYAGNPLIGETDTVKVIIFKPGDDLGHLMATYATPELNQDSINGDETSGYYQKFLSLMNNDSSFYNSLLPSEQIIILEHQGNGHYTGFFDKTELSGIYQIHFLLKGEIPGNGTFIREKLKTAVFEFGLMDNSETNYNIDLTQGDKYQTAIITIRPKNKFGNYMGPGYLSQIKIKLNKKQIVIRDKADNLNGSYIRDKADNLDGSYTFTIVNIPLEINPKDFKIFVKGEEFIPGCTPITLWHFIILIIIILILIIVLIKKVTSKKVKTLIWLILILWILYMILQHFNIYCMNLF